MKTIKIIDLLNKIANGEEVPKKIKCEGDILKYDKSIQDYIGVSKIGSGLFFNYLFVNHQTSFFINNEVEIIEDEIIEDEDVNIQDIEEIDKNGTFRNGEINHQSIIDMQNKINNLIKAVKKLDKEMNKNENI